MNRTVTRLKRPIDAIHTVNVANLSYMPDISNLKKKNILKNGVVVKEVIADLKESFIAEGVDLKVGINKEKGFWYSCST